VHYLSIIIVLVFFNNKLYHAKVYGHEVYYIHISYYNFKRFHKSPSSLAHNLGYNHRIIAYRLLIFRFLLILKQIRPVFIRRSLSDAVSASGHRVVDDEVINYVTATRTDTSVVQCNVSNRNGYLYTNIALIVIGRFFLNPVLNFHLNPVVKKQVNNT